MVTTLGTPKRNPESGKRNLSVQEARSRTVEAIRRQARDQVLAPDARSRRREDPQFRSDGSARTCVGATGCPRLAPHSARGEPRMVSAHQWFVEHCGVVSRTIDISPVVSVDSCSGRSSGSGPTGDAPTDRSIFSRRLELRGVQVKLRAPPGRSSRRLRAIPKGNLVGQIDEGAQARGHVAASWIVEAKSRIRGRPLA
jgi:hypothetical protein